MDDLKNQQEVSKKTFNVPVISSVPVGVKIIAVLYYIIAVIFAIFGILLLIVAIFGKTFIENIPIPGLTESAGPGFSIALLLIVGVGILLIAFGVLSFFVGKSLWKAKKWARIAAIILAALGVIVVILSLIPGGRIKMNISSLIINLVIQGFIIGYLLFSKKVKETFA